MKKYFYFLCITILPLCGVWACSNENTESHDEFGNQGENIPTAIKKLDYGQLLAFPGAEGHGRSTTGGRGGSVCIMLLHWRIILLILKKVLSVGRLLKKEQGQSFLMWQVQLN